jgi:hypothetical protein
LIKQLQPAPEQEIGDLEGHEGDDNRNNNEDHQHQANSGDIIKFKISHKNGNSLSYLVEFRLPSAKAEALRKSFSPKFKSEKCRLYVSKMTLSIIVSDQRNV